MMMFTSKRLSLLAALLLSGALWLAVSSVTANAVHTLAKENFSWHGFGSVSIWLIVVCFAWLICASYLLAVNMQLTAKNQAIGICVVTIWIGILLVLTGLGDQWLGRLGAAALVVWFIEIAVAALLVIYLFRQSRSFFSLEGISWFAVMALIWLTAAKMAFLLLSPGISIRL
jgi:hypothetical protein